MTGTVVENGHDDPSSNSGRSCLYFTYPWTKGMNSRTLHPAWGK